jgi:hypothetical protein
MALIKNILGVHNNGLLRFLIVLFLPYYVLMDSVLYVVLSDSNLPIVTPLQIEEILNNFFGETVVQKPLTKKQMKKDYEDYRSRSFKNSKKINQIVTFKDYRGYKKKNYKTWRGEELTYKKDWDYSYKVSCILYTILTYFLIIRINTWIINILGG